jgi:hypothetical protein
MSCKIEGCQLPKNHFNPLIAPFTRWHGKVVKSFEAFPKKAIAKEIAKRIAILVAAPFAYLALGILALAGLLSHSDYKRNHRIELKSAKLKKQDEMELQKKKIEESQGLKGMINALGGIQNIRELHPPADWKGTFELKELSSPVMSYYHQQNPCFIITYLKPQKTVEDNFQFKKEGTTLCSDIILWDRKNEEWKLLNDGELGYHPSKSFIAKGSAHEKFMLDRIGRLIKGEPVGMLQNYPGMGLFIPEDKSSYKPADSYLKGEDLVAYMKIPTKYYEVEPLSGTTDLFLYDPGRTAIENFNSFYEKYPASSQKKSSQIKDNLA